VRTTTLPRGALGSLVGTIIMIIAFALFALLVYAGLCVTALRRHSALAARIGAALLAACVVGSLVLGRRADAEEWTWGWVPPLNLNIHLALDDFAVAMVCLVAGLGALVLWYSVDYFADHRAYTQFVGLFMAFAVAMLGLVLSADLFSMFVFWELTSVISFLLIGMNDESASARSAALRALLVTGAGGLCLLIGVTLFQVSTGSSAFGVLAEVDQGGAMFTTAAMFAMVGALTKSAQFPFHFWLPGAMSAPTPVSAYLHSATMVKAGIVLMARLSPAITDVSVWRWAAVLLGGITMVLGGVRALRQVDTKLLLAHSTVSQLGFLTVLVGMGNPVALYAGVAHLVAHAVFKAGLFMSVGIVDHEAGSRDIRVLSGVGKQLPVIAILTAISAASMAGVMPFLGFATKEKALATLIDGASGDDSRATVALVFVVIGAVLSAAYSVRLVRGLFAVKKGVPATQIHHAPAVGLVAPMALTVVVTVVAGLAAGWWGTLMKPVAQSLNAEATGKLALWPGFNSALVVSILVLIAGGVLGWRIPVEPKWPTLRISGERIFQSVYEGVLSFCAHVTRYSQSGSLSAYNVAVMVMVVLAVGIPVTGLIGDVSGDVVIADSVAQVAMVVLAASFALGAARTQRRFAAALLLGGLGFACAVIFALFGAPDVALTQLLVECLVIVVLLLVVRQMPRRFPSEISWIPRSLRLVVSIAVGLVMATFALMTSLSRNAPSVGDEYLVRSKPEGAGSNVVNVILVDFRGTDTLGEVIVLLVAGIGIVNLVRMAQRRRREDPDKIEMAEVGE